MFFSKILLIILRTLVTSAEAALPVLVAEGKVSASQATTLTTLIGQIGNLVLTISTELASTDSAVAKIDTIRAAIEAIVIPNIGKLPKSIQVYFLPIDIALAATLALFPATAPASPAAFLTAHAWTAAPHLDPIDPAQLASLGVAGKNLAAALGK